MVQKRHKNISLTRRLQACKTSPAHRTQPGVSLVGTHKPVDDVDLQILWDRERSRMTVRQFPYGELLFDSARWYFSPRLNQHQIAFIQRYWEHNHAEA